MTILEQFEEKLKANPKSAKEWIWLFVEAEQIGEEAIRLWQQYNRTGS